MSRRLLRNCNVADSDSSSSRERRHPYNTRSSGRCPTPPEDYSRNSMDCVDEIPPPIETGAARSRGWGKIFLTAIISSGILGAFCSNLWILYRMNGKIKKLQDEVVNAPSLSKEVEAEISKLDKKYSEVLKQLNGDPVGRPDFALESSGGRVITTDGVARDVSKKFFGLWVYEGCAHLPSSMIRPTAAPGECWAFKGHKASAVIQLVGFVKIDAITVEHIPHTLSPTGQIDSAPRNFKLWGLADSKPKGERNLLGDFEYEAKDAPVQIFNVSNNTEYYKYVEFQVLSNHGNKEYTCVYRLRVHGQLKSSNWDDSQNYRTS